MKIAIIYWKDATIHGTDQMNAEKAKKLGLSIGISSGIIVYEDREKITLAMDSFTYQEDDIDYRILSTFPKSGITKIKRFDVFPTS